MKNSAGDYYILCSLWDNNILSLSCK